MGRVNASFRSDDARGRAMSNFSAHPFVIDGIRCASVEAFIQGIKFPPDDPRREEVFAMGGVAAWKMRVYAVGDYVWWGGVQISYRSAAHAELIRRAIEAKFAQNPDAFDALTSTRGLEIIHEPGGVESPLTSLPATVYCKILTDIREAAP